MTVIGFNFSSITAKRNKPAKGQVKINRKCTPTSVEEVSMGGGQKALRYNFEFSVTYEPGIAEIAFEGKLVELVKEEEHKNVLETWEKNQKIPPQSFERVMNELLDRCHTEALFMAKELSIPAPFKLPGVKVKKKDEE
jgi:hypothetical protein